MMDPQQERHLWNTVLVELHAPLPLPSQLVNSNLDWYLDLCVPILAFFGCISGTSASPHAPALIKWLHSSEHHTDVIAKSDQYSDVLEDIARANFIALAALHRVNWTTSDSKRHGLLMKKDRIKVQRKLSGYEKIVLKSTHMANEAKIAN